MDTWANIIFVLGCGFGYYKLSRTEFDRNLCTAVNV